MSVPDFNFPPAPSPSTITLFATILRTILAGLSGMGIATGWILSDAQLAAISAMLLVAGSLVSWIAVGVWSLYQKYKSTRDDHAGSVASAQASANATITAGTPIAIVVPPPP